jgi:hydroxymethylpyrimidine/phosphomethylpyrimidine kinase
MPPVATCPRVLTVAGSDSSGGAGIQADLKTFTAHRVWGASVLTALTAQNEAGVRAVAAIDPEFFTQQFDAVMDEASFDAAKTGMLGNGRIIEALCLALDRRPLRNLIVDPVLVATSGALLFDPADLDRYRGELIPRARVVTPNLHELEALTGIEALDENAMREGALRIARWGANAVLVKGGHLASSCSEAIDVFYDGQTFHRLAGPRFEGRSTHGTGCTLSAAIAANLALGHDLVAAVREAKTYTTRCIERGFRWDGGAGGLNHFHNETS